MPRRAHAGGDLTDDEILAVVCHERYTLGGADPTADEYVEEFENWCSEEAPIFAALEEGGTLADLDRGRRHERRRATSSRSSTSATRPPRDRRPSE